METDKGIKIPPHILKKAKAIRRKYKSPEELHDREGTMVSLGENWVLNMWENDNIIRIDTFLFYLVEVDGVMLKSKNKRRK